MCKPTLHLRELKLDGGRIPAVQEKEILGILDVHWKNNKRLFVGREGIRQRNSDGLIIFLTY